VTILDFRVSPESQAVGFTVLMKIN
jgi:hypothetical protein